MDSHRSVSQRMTHAAGSAMQQPNRRLFLRWCGAAAMGGSVMARLAGCRRRGEKPATVTPPGAQHETLNERPAPPVSEPVVRVRIRRVRNAAEPMTVGGSDQWLALARGDAPDQPVALRAPIQVAIAPAGWSVIDAKGFRPNVQGLSDLIFQRLAHPDPTTTTDARHTPESPITFGEAVYPGRLRFISRTDLAPESIDVINDVPIEQYLPGVIAEELFSHWSIETFAALAVAARSFACSEHAFFKERRQYDLTNTAASQMYAGAVDHENAHRAVNTTRGVVLVWNDRLVPGYYSSCCGGQPAAAVDAIGPNPINDIAPLAGAADVDACRESPVYEWTVKRSVHDVSRRLLTWAEVNHLKPLSNFTRVKSIQVADRNHTGRPRLYRIVDRTGTEVKVPARYMRSACNYTGRGLAEPKQPLLSSNVAVTINRSTATFHGRGFGHGAGLCQYGAQALAQSGERFQSILRTYYPDVELMRAYA